MNSLTHLFFSAEKRQMNSPEKNRGDSFRALDHLGSLFLHFFRIAKSVSKCDNQNCSTQDNSIDLWQGNMMLFRPKLRQRRRICLFCLLFACLQQLLPGSILSSSINKSKQLNQTTKKYSVCRKINKSV